MVDTNFTVRLVYTDNIYLFHRQSFIFIETHSYIIVETIISRRGPLGVNSLDWEPWVELTYGYGLLGEALSGSSSFF